MSRRRTKTEREIITDIKKLLKSYCNSYNGCNGCKYMDDDCEVAFAIDLFKKSKKENDEENNDF